MAKDDGGEKTEAPTAKRKREARKEGRVAKTNELGIWLQVLAGTVGLQLTFNSGLSAVRSISYDIHRIAQDPDPLEATGMLGNGMGKAVMAVLPLAMMMMVIGVVALLSQTGLMFATKAAKPKFSKVNPLQGIKRLVQPQGIWQGVKSLIKLSVLTFVSWEPVLGITKTLLDAGQLPITMSAMTVVEAAMSLSRTVAIVGLALALADFTFQKHQINKTLKMSKKEIQEEFKQAEGDPHIKGQIRRRQQEMSRNRMLAAVGDASVVIVNPTHIAVAIKYAPGTGAPKVVAKGRGLIADRIREEASKNFVPIVRDIPLARTLEKACKVDQTIPADLYEAVARLLAFVMQVGRRASNLGDVLENPHAQRLPVPV